MNNEQKLNILESRYGDIVTHGEEDLITKSLEYYGEWANNEIEIHKKLIKNGDVVLDVGTYLGTHLSAYSQFVGTEGQVFGFEPNRESYDLVSQMVKLNSYNNIVVKNFALGAEHQLLDGENIFDVQSFNHGSFSLKVIPEDSNTVDVSNDIINEKHIAENNNSENSDVAIEINTLDSLNLKKIDFIKIDAEGMEHEVLEGGTKTLLATRPIIFCECNDVESGFNTLKWAQKNNFLVYAINIPAFNEENFNKNSTDFFYGASEVSLVLLPKEKEGRVLNALAKTKFKLVETIEDVYLVLLTKKQFIEEGNYSRLDLLSYDKFKIFNKSKSSIFDIPDRRGNIELIIAVPFYKSPELVTPLYDSLIPCAHELDEYNVEVIFYNDSPEDIHLRDEFEKIKLGSHAFKLSIIENDKNLGFIGTMNQALSHASGLSADIILLNSDTLFFPGVIKELIEVAYSDPMIGFVSPRSNNATICTFPHQSRNDTSTPYQIQQQFMSIAHAFPRYTFVPTCVGFCLFIKNKILSEFGLLDEAYGKGYNEENDYIMRANRCGYSAVIANHAFIWHEGEKSFSNLEVKRNLREEENAKILHERYPEFPKLIHNYFHSVEYRGESILEGLIDDIDGRLTIAFDFTALGTYHNGTFEAGKKLIIASDKCWPNKYNIAIICGEAAFKFHEIEAITSSRVSWQDPSNFDTKVAAVIRIGQPFSPHAISQGIYRAPVTACFMLDTIAADCGYLKLDFDENIWRFMLNWSDIIFTNSFYTASQFVRRYDISEEVILRPTLHSTSLSDYYDGVKENSTNCSLSYEKTLLIIGNKFEHKGLKTAIPLLADRFKSFKFKVLGGDGYFQSNVECIPTGHISDEEINSLYESVDAFIFPSHYEGFGFPLLHSLAHNKIIFARDIPVYHEIKNSIKQGGENVIIFNSLEELCSQLQDSDLVWKGEPAAGEDNGWQRSSFEVLESIETAIQHVKLNKITNRLRWFELVYCQSNNGLSQQNLDAPTNIGNRIGQLVQRISTKILKQPSLYRFFRILWRSYKKLAK